MNMFSFEHCALCSMNNRFHRSVKQGHKLFSYCSTQAVVILALGFLIQPKFFQVSTDGFSQRRNFFLFLTECLISFNTKE